ncbi:MAG: phosphatase PAP2 family protein [Bacteroidetes bacterium]|nr:phosphatase PAP2 family protein [Bacteroidota bacterium]
MKYILLFFISLNLTVSAQNIDIDILKSINLNRNKKLDNTFIALSNSVVPVSIAVPLGVIGAGCIKHDSIIKNKGIVIGASLAIAAGITTGLKYSVKRERPFISYPTIDKVMNAGSPSFPSGHTSDAFATATSLSLAFPQWYVIAPSFVWACSVGYSRMDLGVHYPSDVLAGAAIGTGTSYLCYKANKWLYERHFRK